jgi:uncharacterized protein
MNNQLQVAEGVTLPRDIVTETVAILAKRRVGKSYTMRRIIEQLLKAGQQIVIVDPKGDQWGIRSSADGTKPGFPVLILGGGHGDLPLEVSGGELVAKLVVEESVSILLDISLFRKSEVAVFMAAFLETLYRLKAQEQYRTPVMLVIDEADAIAPQKPQHGEERMLGAAEDIVRRGGQRGIGCILVTQRSAVLNKNVLTQAQMLVALRTIAPQDLTAMKAWIDVHGTAEQRQVLMESLPSLPIGDAWFWSPGWPTEDGIFKRAHVYPIETFDSAATPKPGERKIVPRNFADVDLESLKRQMAATIEKAKKDDPVALRKEVARLQSELTKQTLSNPPRISGPLKIERIEVPAIGKRTLAGLKKAEATMRRILAAAKDAASQTADHLATVEKCLTAFSADLNKAEQKRSESAPNAVQTPVALRPTAPSVLPSAVAGDVSGPEQRVLNAVAWMENIGVREPEKAIVAFLSGYAHLLSKGFTNPCSMLRTKELISYPAPGKIALTDPGRAAAQFPGTVGTNDELHRIILDRLDGPKRRVLKPLLDAYPEPISGEALASAAGYAHPMSKGYTNPRSALRSFGLIDYPSPGMVRAADILFI